MKSCFGHRDGNKIPAINASAALRRKPHGTCKNILSLDLMDLISRIGHFKHWSILLKKALLELHVYIYKNLDYNSLRSAGTFRPRSAAVSVSTVIKVYSRWQNPFTMYCAKSPETSAVIWSYISINTVPVANFLAETKWAHNGTLIQKSLR